MIAAGIFLLWAVISSLAKRKMTESFCLVWGVVAVSIILAGVLLRPSELYRYISLTGLLLCLLIGFCILYSLFFMSTKVSELMRENRELSMQVSLLKHEKEEMYKIIGELSERIDRK